MNETNELPFAEECNYWQTSRSSPDTWLDRTCALVEKFGGAVHQEAFGSADGRSAYMLAFSIGPDAFKVVWPVLPSKTENGRAAKTQAATMLYRDVKARLVSAQVHGARAALFSYLLLADGRTASSASRPELAAMLPPLLPRMIE